MTLFMMMLLLLAPPTVIPSPSVSVATTVPLHPLTICIFTSAVDKLIGVLSNVNVNVYCQESPFQICISNCAGLKSLIIYGIWHLLFNESKVNETSARTPARKSGSASRK